MPSGAGAISNVVTGFGKVGATFSKRSTLDLTDHIEKGEKGFRV